MIAEFIATIIAKCCDTHEQQLQLASAGVVQALTNLLHCGYIKAQEAALDALSTLGRENAQLAEIIIHAKSTMIEFVKNKCPHMRLIAATCLTNLYRSDVFSEPFDEIVLVVLPALVRLMSEETGEVQEQAPLVLADLIKDSEDMQKAAFESDTIPKLAELLASVSSKDSNQNEEIGVPGVGSVEKRKEKTKENCLIALAAATLLKEECRAQAIDNKILPHVVSALQSTHHNVRLAACQCAKSLSRSVSNLRTSLVDAGIAPPLIKLLHDDSVIVQAAACAALCNLALDFSPMKKTVIDAGAITKFVEYCRSSDPQLQLNGIWAIKSLLYKADLAAKKAVMDILTFDSLIELLHEPKPGVQEQAMDAVRNLICGQVEDVEYVIDGIGQDDLLDVLESKLQVTSSMGNNNEDEDEQSQAVGRIKKQKTK
ncbi:armadillo-type protein [Chlamydoabsidia padenii]|nr:armadillo-type protein [Chlamydoabsidia padenii]